MLATYALLTKMADGKVHSGAALGEAIGVSRTAIWKHIQKFKQWGVECRAVPGVGYQLEHSLDLLNEEKLRAGLTSKHIAVGEFNVFAEIDSTNAYLLSQPRSRKNTNLDICLAEFQTAGRGRRGRQWQSPFAANLYLSVRREFPCGVNELSGLSLAVGVAVARAIESLSAVKIQLKWPNDLRAHGRKLGGILIELSGEANGPCSVVIGVGINVHMQVSQGLSIEQPWISLDDLATGVTRTDLALTIVENFSRMAFEFEQSGFCAFQQDFTQRDEFHGQPVQISGLNETVLGVVAGVDEQGTLLLQTDAGLRKVFAGEVSMRKTV